MTCVCGTMRDYMRLMRESYTRNMDEHQRVAFLSTHKVGKELVCCNGGPCTHPIVGASSLLRSRSQKGMEVPKPLKVDYCDICLRRRKKVVGLVGHKDIDYDFSSANILPRNTATSIYDPSQFCEIIDEQIDASSGKPHRYIAKFANDSLTCKLQKTM